MAPDSLSLHGDKPVPTGVKVFLREDNYAEVIDCPCSCTLHTRITAVGIGATLAIRMSLREYSE